MCIYTHTQAHTHACACVEFASVCQPNSRDIVFPSEWILRVPEQKVWNVISERMNLSSLFQRL